MRFWAFLLVMWLAPTSAFAQPGHLPEDLAQVARSAGCQVLPDYYARPGRVDPPYVYGVLDGEKDRSAAFWCRVSEFAYRLIVVQNGIAADEIRWRDEPGGLSMSERQDFDLSLFRYVEDRGAPGPGVIVSNRRAIVDYYDGIMVWFIKHDGRWLFRLFH